MQFEPTRLYRVRSVAEALDVSVATIYRAVESGALRAERHGRGKGAVRIPGDAITAYRAACERAAATAPLTLPQAETSCVICGLDLNATPVPRYPVGRTNTGVQVYACDSHRETAASAAGGAA